MAAISVSTSPSLDGLGRLRSAQSTGSEWGNTYIYDAWGNLTNMEAVTGKSNYWPLAKPADYQNRLTGDLHDAAANLWNNGQYTWDAENRMASGGGVTYTYDGDGKRAKKTGGVLYWTGIGADALTETDLSGGVTSEYIFFNGKRVARIDAGGTAYYYLADHLGTTRMMTTAAGAVCYDADFYPYGPEQHVYTNTCSQKYKFTGKERDSETGLDYFGARYYGSNMGRWMSPDWNASPEPVPYADLFNPQTLNLYSYVGNAPVTRTDPDGHKDFWEKFKNWAKYGHFVLNSKLNVALANDANLARMVLLDANLIYHGNRLDLPALGNMTNQQVMDVLQEYQVAQLKGEVAEQQYPLVRDATGKVHADIPDHVPDNWTKEDLEMARGELKESIKQREAEQLKYGEEGGHREAIRRERQLLRQVEKKLSGS